VIGFGISCDVSEEFKEAVRRVSEKEWRPLRRKGETEYTQEWTEVAYTSNELSRSKKDPEIRFFATRQAYIAEDVFAGRWSEAADVRAQETR
jgi:hypothetical protein